MAKLTADTITRAQIAEAWSDDRLLNLIRAVDLAAAMDERIAPAGKPSWSEEQVRAARERIAHVINTRDEIIAAHVSMFGAEPSVEAVRRGVQTALAIDDLNARAAGKES